MAALTASAPTSREHVDTRRLPSLLLTTDGTPIASLPQTPETETLIGRAAHAALHVASDPYVSAYHAVIRWDDLLQTHVITDCGSRNGTFVDDVRVAGTIRLTDGAHIRIGLTEIVYRSRYARTGVS